MNQTTPSFGMWLRHRRKTLDLTQDELAQRVGYSLGAIRKLEADERRPSPELAERLADTLQVPAAERAAFLKVARAERAVDGFVLTPAVAPPGGHRHPHLPVPLTRLIGREREVAAVVARLRGEEVRLLTLTGPGGVGKTRLALQVAAALVEDFPDGVYFVDLAPVRDSNFVIGAIAQTVGVRDVGGQQLASLKDYLRDKRMLLVLDNFEHLLAAAPLAAQLLASTAQLKVLATSREQLHLRGEQEVAVPPLALPLPDKLPPVEQLSQYAAVALFLAHARAVDSAFQLTHANAPAVAEICVRLDGLPLAIELAVARIKVFPPEALRAQLRNRLALLTGGPRDLPARQQTIRHTIAWSYDLLNAGEQMLFRRLGVFVGSCTLAAIHVVCATENDPPIDVLEDVAALVDKSLLRQVEGPDSAPRFTLLETIREYALEQLEVSGEADVLRRRHATYFRDTAQTYTSRRDFLRSITPERDNLRAALAWSQSTVGDPALALDLVLPVARIESLRGDYQGVRYLLAQVLEYAEGLIDTQRYAEVSVELGQFMSSLGDLVGGRALVEQSYMLYQKLSDKSGETYALVNLGWVAREQGDAATARPLLEQAVVLSRELGDANLLIYALMTLAEVAVLEENTVSAEMLLEECLALSRQGKDPQHLGYTFNHLGHAAQLRGDYDRAAQLHSESLALLIELLGEKNNGVAEAWHSLGETAIGQGNPAGARGWLAAALQLCVELGNRVTSAWCLAGMGTAAALDEEPEHAAQLWGAAERLRATLGCRSAPAARATYERALAKVHAQLGEEGFAAAWEAGTALTLEQAITKVLANRS